MQASKVTYVYDEGTKALDAVDFCVEPGEFVALLASNGSGKTTLIKVLVGLLEPQEGWVKINGKNVGDLTRKELSRMVGVVLQNPVDQLFAATVDEDVAYGPRNLGMNNSDEIDQRIAWALGLVAALELRGRPIHHLSFGEQKRVAIAGVLAMSPSILILDEPTAGLDPSGETLMMKLLNRLNREGGITVLLATHSVDLLPLFADRIYILRHGKVLKQGPPDVIFRDQDIIEAAGLRLPYVADLLHQMKEYDGVPINGLPLTLGEARKRLLELIPQDLLIKSRQSSVQ
ncbi:MAG: energy-coupling factor ABC transporter ATP-binding protein [Desulfomonilaceae bacterium]